MKKHLLLLVILFSIGACSTQEDQPADLLPEKKMTGILVDIHLEEARIGRTIANYDTSRAAFKQQHKHILKKHGVTDSAFKHSYDYYLSHPAEMDKVYERVIDSLSAMEAKMTPKVPGQAKPSADTSGFKKAPGTAPSLLN
ncbi:MAG: DUF4296 domain-containing protein [Rufibacter sp.]